MTASCAYVLGHIGMCALERKDSVGNIAAVPCHAMKSELDSMDSRAKPLSQARQVIFSTS